MLHRIRRYNDIANVNLRAQGTGDTCVHNRTDMEPIRQNLTAHTCIYLADTRANHNRVLSTQFTLIKIHTSYTCHGDICHFLLDLSHLFIHRSDDS